MTKTRREKDIMVAKRLHQIGRRDFSAFSSVPSYTMRRRSAESTAIRSFGYDRQTGVLIVRFKRSQATYAYKDVPYEVYWGLIHAESKGKYFHAFIQDTYSYVQIMKHNRYLVTEEE